MMNDSNLIAPKDLQKKTDYWLTGDHFPYAGKKVRLKKLIPARNVFPGVQGFTAIVTRADGSEMVLNPHDKLFNVPPALESE